MKRTNQLVVLGLSLAAAACGDPLKKAQQIEEPRVLAVQVEGDARTATPGEGEDAVARLLFAGPDGPQPMRLAYQICEAVDSARGVPTCGGDVFAEGTLPPDSSAPEIPFVAEAPEGTRLAVLAAACLTGEPSLADDPTDWACDDGTQPLNASFDGWVGGDERNENPQLDSITIEVDGEQVALDDADTEADCDTDALIVDAGKTHGVVIDLGDSSREDDEWLQLSHFATSGEYERQFSVIEPTEQPGVELTWEAPKGAASSKHYLVVRDGLGGVAFVTWSVCAE